MTASEMNQDIALRAYLQTYSDLIDDLPVDLARLISEIHRIDVKRDKYIRKIQHCQDFICQEVSFILFVCLSLI